jgi:glycosyltransferase involved in cell wall biosynthesis
VRVSLISTVKDAGPHIDDFLRSLHAQTRGPDEAIVVDGGSTDGTLDALRRDAAITVLSEPGASISRGRNVAIERASHDVIAVTDADCVLSPDWLERLVGAMERTQADVVAGFYRPIARAPWQVWASAHVPDAHEVGPGWMPSSRSITFRRRAWDAAGRYPEWLAVGEDMYFNHRLVEAGCRIARAMDAVVGWPVRPTLTDTWRQYARYAEGDARAGMYPKRHAARFAAYAFATLALATGQRTLLVLTAIGAAAYSAKPIRRAIRRTTSRPMKAAAPVGVPLMTAFIDVAKMAGYLRGSVRAGSPRT